MSYIGKYPASFINVIADDGNKQEALEWLQRTWDDLCDARKRLAEVEKDARRYRWLVMRDEFHTDEFHRVVRSSFPAGGYEKRAYDESIDAAIEQEKP